MASYPATIESPDVTMQGSTTLAGDDHALSHRVAGSAVIDVQTFLGTNSSTNVFSGYQAGWFPLALNGGTPQIAIQHGTFPIAILGTPSITNGAYIGGTISSIIQNNGTVNNGVYGTPSVDFIQARNAGTGIGFSQSIFPSEGTITDSAGGTFTVDARASQIYYSVMGTAAGNRTLGTPTNPSNYQQLTYAFKTSGSANGTLVFSSSFRISQDYGTPTLGTGVSWNYYTFRYNLIDTKWDFQGQQKNLI